MSVTPNDIRRAIPNEEFDYQTLMSLIGEYRSPRDKITRLINDGVITRVKKGLYIFGPNYRKEPYSREVLANLIFGPSYISLEYALSYYGMIPEKVTTLTSVCTGRSRQFDTSVGRFNYRQIPLGVYPIGIEQIAPNTNRSFLIAAPEKALCDFVQSQRGLSLFSIMAMIGYLTDNLRIDETDLGKMDVDSIRQIAKMYNSRRIEILSKAINRLKES